MSNSSVSEAKDRNAALQSSSAVSEKDGLSETWRARLSWGALLQLATLSLAVLGAYLFWQELDRERLLSALATADRGLLLLALLLVTANLLVKTWRWQFAFDPSEPTPSYGTALSAFSMGVLVNSVVPLRLGEVTRLTVIHRLSRVGLVRGASTVAIEKTFEALTLLFSGALLLPFISLPEAVAARLEWLALFFSVLGFALFGGAYLGSVMVRRQLVPVPNGKSRRLAALGDLIVLAVRSLSALRQPRRIAGLALMSTMSVMLAVATPLVLFRAFEFGYGFREAVAMNLVVSIGLIPPSTPGKLVVFEALALFMLQRFGVASVTLGVGYAITYHLVVLLPQLLLGVGAGIFVASRLGANLPSLFTAGDDA